jgi:hypothetical protein
MRVGEGDQARDVVRQTGTLEPGVAVGPMEGVGVGLVPGPGVALGGGLVPGPGGGDPPASRASSCVRASLRVALQTTWRGDATTIRTNWGNAEPVDWR